MRVLDVCAAVAAVAMTTGVALAGSQGYPGDMYMPGSAGFVAGDTGGQPLVQAYPGGNMCTNGRQPVIVGGEISCGVPTGGTYYNPSDRVSRGTAAPLPRAYAPAGEKGVAYR